MLKAGLSDGSREIHVFLPRPSCVLWVAAETTATSHSQGDMFYAYRSSACQIAHSSHQCHEGGHCKHRGGDGGDGVVGSSRCGGGGQKSCVLHGGNVIEYAF